MTKFTLTIVTNFLAGSEHHRKLLVSTEMKLKFYADVLVSWMGHFSFQIHSFSVATNYFLTRKTDVAYFSLTGRHLKAWLFNIYYSKLLDYGKVICSACDAWPKLISCLFYGILFLWLFKTVVAHYGSGSDCLFKLYFALSIAACERIIVWKTVFIVQTFSSRYSLCCGFKNILTFCNSYSVFFYAFF